MTLVQISDGLEYSINTCVFLYALDQIILFRQKFQHLCADREIFFLPHHSVEQKFKMRSLIEFSLSTLSLDAMLIPKRLESPTFASLKNFIQYPIAEGEDYLLMKKKREKRKRPRESEPLQDELRTLQLVEKYRKMASKGFTVDGSKL